MGAAILSISLELCKLLPFLSACELNVQTFFFFNFFPGKPVEERVKEMGQSKTQLGRWGRGLGRRHLLFLEGQPLLGAWAGDVQQDTRCARCCLLPRCTPRTHPRSSGLFLQKKKTSRVIQRALDDARESRASPMRSRKGFGKGTLAMAARGELPPRGRCGSTCRVGWGALGAAPRNACVRREGFVLQLSLCHLPEALPPPSASPSLPDVRSAGARKFPVRM